MQFKCVTIDGMYKKLVTNNKRSLSNTQSTRRFFINLIQAWFCKQIYFKKTVNNLNTKTLFWKKSKIKNNKKGDVIFFILISKYILSANLLENKESVFKDSDDIMSFQYCTLIWDSTVNSF